MVYDVPNLDFIHKTKRGNIESFCPMVFYCITNGKIYSQLMMVCTYYLTILVLSRYLLNNINS